MSDTQPSRDDQRRQGWHRDDESAIRTLLKEKAGKIGHAALSYIELEGMVNEIDKLRTLLKAAVKQPDLLTGVPK